MRARTNAQEKSAPTPPARAFFVRAWHSVPMESILTAGVRGFAEGALARPFPWGALAILGALLVVAYLARVASR